MTEELMEHLPFYFAIIYFAIIAVDSGGLSRQLLSNVCGTIAYVSTKAYIRGLTSECPLFDDELQSSFAVPVSEFKMTGKVREILRMYNKAREDRQLVPLTQHEVNEWFEEALNALKEKANLYYEAIDRIFLHCVVQGFAIPLNCIHPFVIQESLGDVVPGDTGYSIDDLVMHIRANLHRYDRDDSQALLFDLTKLVREYLGFQMVEEYALRGLIGTRHSAFEHMVKGFTRNNAYICCAFKRLRYQNVVETHFTEDVSFVEVENALKPEYTVNLEEGSCLQTHTFVRSL